jgi:hypothetical protein
MKATIENQTVTHKHATIDEIRSGSVSDLMNLFDVRHQLMLRYGETDDIKELTDTQVKGHRRRGSSLALAQSVENALYCFVAAPALLYLVYLVVRPLTGGMP